MSLKLYFFENAISELVKQILLQDAKEGEWSTIPIPFFLIKHPKGNVLFDTGLAAEVATDPEKYLGSELCDGFTSNMKPENFVVNQLHKVGIEPEDISYVVMSHLHMDHAGGVGAFPNATYIVQEKELDWAYRSESVGYVQADFDKPVNWLLLKAEKDDGYDIFGDGLLKIWFTPGHTPGSQSLLVQLEKEKAFLLAGDSCYIDAILNEGLMPGLFWDAASTIKSLDRMRNAQKTQNIKVIAGHDIEAWKGFKKAPKYYE